MNLEKIPRLGDVPSLARDVAFALADMYSAAGTHIKAPNPVLHASSQGDAVKLGICVAADALRKVLSRHEEGLVALGDLGLEITEGHSVGCRAKSTKPTGFDSLGMPIYPQESSFGAGQ